MKKCPKKLWKRKQNEGNRQANGVCKINEVWQNQAIKLRPEFGLKLNFQRDQPTKSAGMQNANKWHFHIQFLLFFRCVEKSSSFLVDTFVVDRICFFSHRFSPAKKTAIEFARDSSGLEFHIFLSVSLVLFHFVLISFLVIRSSETIAYDGIVRKRMFKRKKWSNVAHTSDQTTMDIILTARTFRFHATKNSPFSTKTKKATRETPSNIYPDIYVRFDDKMVNGGNS